MCLPSLRRARHTLNYPKDTQLNTPSPASRTCDTALRVLRSFFGRGLLSLVIFFYPIDFVVKHPVAPEVNPAPTLGWVEQLLGFPERCSKFKVFKEAFNFEQGFCSCEHFFRFRGLPSAAKAVEFVLPCSTAEAVPFR
jgi:hypothetical protein